MCIPIGPINVWVINVQLKKNSKNALALALGGAVMDFFYFFVILSGLSFLTFGDNLTKYFKIAGVALIFILGAKELISKTVIIDEKAEDVTKKKDLLAYLLLGVILYTSNPTLILTMTGLGAFVKSLGLFEFSMLNISFISFGLALGSFLWFVFLVSIVKKYQKKIREKYLGQLAKISGILMILLSIFMSFKFYKGE